MQLVEACDMTGVGSGWSDKLYWRNRDDAGMTPRYHCYKKLSDKNGGFISLCDEALRRFRSGGQRCGRPEKVYRCEECDTKEMMRRGWMDR